ncbi:hemolysin family protein [Aureibacillus halotolerans]|uniref:CBS domain containing-hemolysin-like protein n=1 Tax=Aureibacillus halotolerans TaxID=1508390 RepID=A0A4R6U1Y9_9BACI|nr:hemolysin family protein [Aureibacillus halotolerans]TDQ38375.1 CBS domain containing-hemolysin-like protein [Aureibacillus halotolerans]
MDTTTIIINFSLVAILIALTAFFVGSEFAVVKVRMSRIEQLIEEGNKRAIIVKKLVSNLDYYLSACQLGITVTALALGFLGEPTIERLILPFLTEWGVPDSLTHVISLVVALSIMTFFHVVVGELAPKTLAIQYAERMTMVLGPMLYWFGQIMKPLIWSLNGSAGLLLRAFKVDPKPHEQAHSEDELKIIMAQSFNSGEINQVELSYMQNIFAFDERVAKDIMVPRTQLVVLSDDMTSEEILQMIDENRYTRYPIVEGGDKDTVLGFVNVKEILTNLAVGRESSLQSSLHEMPTVHETTSLQDVMLKMQHAHIHIALVIDEYGGTAGIVSMEDVLEEIVGDIRDEFDEDEVADIEEKSEGVFVLNGRVLLEDLEGKFGIKFDPDSDELDTIGGWMQVNATDSDNLQVPVEYKRHRFQAVEVDNHQILQVQLELNVLDPNEELDEPEESQHAEAR